MIMAGELEQRLGLGLRLLAASVDSDSRRTSREPPVHMPSVAKGAGILRGTVTSPMRSHGQTPKLLAWGCCSEAHWQSEEDGAQSPEEDG